jgi:hypothetical protein
MRGFPFAIAACASCHLFCSKRDVIALLGSLGRVIGEPEENKCASLESRIE